MRSINFIDPKGHPVAHIIERGSAEFPQKYGKPIVYSLEEFQRLYGEKGIEMTQETDRGIIVENGLVWAIRYCY